jgi:hypothetical protein
MLPLKENLWFVLKAFQLKSVIDSRSFCQAISVRKILERERESFRQIKTYSFGMKG